MCVGTDPYSVSVGRYSAYNLLFCEGGSLGNRADGAIPSLGLFCNHPELRDLPSELTPNRNLGKKEGPRHPGSGPLCMLHAR